MPLHPPRRVREVGPAVLPVQAVGIAGEQDPSPQPLQFRVVHDGPDQPLGKSPAAVRLLDVDIAQVGDGGHVADHAREADLLGALVHAVAARMRDGAQDPLPGDVQAPVGLGGEEGMDGVEVQERLVGGDVVTLDHGRGGDDQFLRLPQAAFRDLVPGRSVHR